MQLWRTLLSVSKRDESKFCSVDIIKYFISYLLKNETNAFIALCSMDGRDVSVIYTSLDLQYSTYKTHLGGDLGMGIIQVKL